MWQSWQSWDQVNFQLILKIDRWQSWGIIWTFLTCMAKLAKLGLHLDFIYVLWQSLGIISTVFDQNGKVGKVGQVLD